MKLGVKFQEVFGVEGAVALCPGHGWYDRRVCATWETDDETGDLS